MSGSPDRGLSERLSGRQVEPCLVTTMISMAVMYGSQHGIVTLNWSHFIWMVPYRLSTDAQIINKLSVETLLRAIYV